MERNRGLGWVHCSTWNNLVLKQKGPMRQLRRQMELRAELRQNPKKKGEHSAARVRKATRNQWEAFERKATRNLKGAGLFDRHRRETTPLAWECRGSARVGGLCPPEATHPKRRGEFPTVRVRKATRDQWEAVGQKATQDLKGTGLFDRRRRETNPLAWECRGSERVGGLCPPEVTHPRVGGGGWRSH